MSWHTNTLVAFDIETTGVDVDNDRIVTATVTRIDVPTTTIDSCGWLVDPGIDIPEGATAVHGITTEHAREHGRPPAQAVREILGQLKAAWSEGAVVIIYNAPFDMSLLDREARRHLGHGIDDIGPIVDPLVCDKAINPFVKGKGQRRLAATCIRYGITLDAEDAHTSAGDALAAARLAWCMSETYPESLDMPLAELQARQADWHAEQAADFERFLRRSRERDGATPEEVAAILIDRAWPLRPYVADTYETEEAS